MTDPRRRRHIDAPSGPKKKASADPSSYKMSRPAMGRKEVPKPKPQQPKRENRQGSKQQRGKQSRGQQQRGGNNRSQRPRQDRPERPKALIGESWARVIEHDTDSGVVTALSEGGFVFCRVKVKSNDPVLIPSQRIYIGTEGSKREHVAEIIGTARLDRMSNMARLDIPVVLQLFVEENAQQFLESFYNRAGPLSLKQHSFELLPDVGKKKAKQMVDARNNVGIFSSMNELNDHCNIDGAELLARRFMQEIEDPTLEPRLYSLLLPVEA
ncbi:MAG: DUF655 domain-containing protein [Candidatus Poseidonia sp.]|nr:DUF655 domain-containing protein [Poseidonia sp.]